jgi:hypothetical protein
MPWRKPKSGTLRTYAWHPLLDQPKKENNHTMDAMRYALTMEAREFPDFKPLRIPMSRAVV